MKQNIKLLTNDCCERLLAFQTDSRLYDNYTLDKFPKDLLQELKHPTRYLISDDINLSSKPENDGENSIKIFNELMQLDRVQANDRRLWVGLTHDRFYQYTRERWVKSDNYSTSAILRRFHFEGASLEARMRNSIARLWWGAKITYDTNRKDPFELTKLLWEKQDLTQNLVERSYGTYEVVIRTFLETYKENRKLSEKELRTLYTGLNAIGGVKVLSLLTKDEVQIELYRLAKYSGIKLN